MTVATTMPEDFREAVYAEHASDALIFLLEIDHASLSETKRLANNTVSITRYGNVYTAAPFEAVMPAERAGGRGPARLKIENTSRDLLQTLRSISTPLQLTFDLVLGSNPESVGRRWTGLKLTELEWDTKFMTGTLTGHRFQGVPYPYKRMTADRFPGLFT